MANQTTNAEIGATLLPSSERNVAVYRSRRRRLKIVKYVVIGIVALLAMLYTLFPIYFVLVGALNPTGLLSASQLVPKSISLENFRLLFSDPAYPYTQWLLNSIKVSLIAALFSVCLTTISAHAFARFRFRGRRPLMKGIVLIQVFPNILALVSVYLIIQQIGHFIPLFGLNTHGALILVYLGGVLGGNVWLMKGYIDSIPIELDQSAMIDGASAWQIFWWIILPLIRPMLAVTFVLAFVATYGDVVLARVLLKDNEQLTVAVGLWQFIGFWQGERWGPFSAGALIAALPPLILFYMLQDWLVTGLTAGSVK